MLYMYIYSKCRINGVTCDCLWSRSLEPGSRDETETETKSNSERNGAPWKQNQCPLIWPIRWCCWRWCFCVYGYGTVILLSSQALKVRGTQHALDDPFAWGGGGMLAACRALYTSHMPPAYVYICIYISNSRWGSVGISAHYYVGSSGDLRVPKEIWQCTVAHGRRLAPGHCVRVVLVLCCAQRVDR